ncbi:MAG: gliding motility-associated C-terminal domain-containing protein, partial [Bacteroidota bacterium]
STHFFGNTCDAAMAGVFTDILSGQNGCDSVVISTISLSASDTTHIFGTNCDPSQTGVFEQILTNQNGCDSVVISTIIYAQADTTHIFGNTCDAAAAGIFTNIFTNQNGCDSVVIENITLLPGDTTHISGTTCDENMAGIFTQIWSNQNGCDSVIISTIAYSQTDTTSIFDTTCDAALAGVFTHIFTNQNGCDSVIIETISLAPSDTTYVFDTSCEPGNTGIFQQLFTNQYGCDSTVILSVSFAQSDTTLLAATTCDPATAGVFFQNFTSADGCDSVVLTTVTWTPGDSVFLVTTTCDPGAAGVFVQNLTAQNGCDSLVTTTVSLLPGSETFLASTTCDPNSAGVFTQILTNQNGCDSIITETIILLASDTTFSFSSTCDPAQAGTSVAIFTNSAGCDSVVLEPVSLNLPPALALETFDFNGFEISCSGAADGSIGASASGAAPFVFSWSNGSNQAELTGLPAGNYSLTVTDANGCTASANATLDEPQPLQISFAINDLDCFEENAGAIFVEATGGASPLRFSLDGVNFQASNAFENLPAGAYQITALDANDCEAAEVILINAPVPVNVDLGEDRFIELGEGATLQALVNVPFDSLASIIWTGLDSSECPTCLTQPVFPLVTSSYSVSIIGENGCRDEDNLTVFVDRRKQLFVPNAFSPNGDGVNDVIYVFAKPGVVKNIRSFLIFDRWGESVFKGENLQPNDPAAGWDGKLRGQSLDPAVFAWWMEVEFVDGEVELFEGDVTLVR